MIPMSSSVGDTVTQLLKFRDVILDIKSAASPSATFSTRRPVTFEEYQNKGGAQTQPGADSPNGEGP